MSRQRQPVTGRKYHVIPATMCPPGCLETIKKKLSRREFLKGAVAGAAAAGLSACTPTGRRSSSRSGGSVRLEYDRVIDLTHSLSSDFPTYGGSSGFEAEQLYTKEKNGFNLKQWKLIEHVGTHIDAPIHFSDDGLTVDQLPAAQLVLPLAVIDIRSRAATDADAQVTPDDIRKWEDKNGALPEGCCLAMCSGWDSKVGDDQFRNADSEGVMHFPGFHPETAAFLLEEREVEGVMVDTLSLDTGSSKDFAFHATWLPSNRWGVECAANLGQLPAVGATVIVGAPKVKDGTGGPGRIMALV